MRARAPVIEHVPRIVTGGKSAFFPLVYAKMVSIPDRIMRFIAADYMYLTSTLLL